MIKSILIIAKNIYPTIESWYNSSETVVFKNKPITKLSISTSIE